MVKEHNKQWKAKPTAPILTTLPNPPVGTLAEHLSGEWMSSLTLVCCREVIGVGVARESNTEVQPN
jgi:hypothetical protein